MMVIKLIPVNKRDPWRLSNIMICISSHNFTNSSPMIIDSPKLLFNFYNTYVKYILKQCATITMSNLCGLRAFIFYMSMKKKRNLWLTARLWYPQCFSDGDTQCCTKPCLHCNRNSVTLIVLSSMEPSMPQYWKQCNNHFNLFTNLKRYPVRKKV